MALVIFLNLKNIFIALRVLLILFLLSLSTPSFAQFGSNSPFPDNITFRDDGTVVEGTGKILDLRTGLSVTFDSLTSTWHLASAGGSVSDTIYGAGWDGDTTVAPSKNAVYDKIETIASGGDNITVNTTAATNANFLDNLYMDIALDAAATPDDVTWKFNFNAASGDIALLTNEVAFTLNGLVSEGVTADTIEGRFAFPDWATSDKVITFQDATHTVVGRDTTDTLTNKTMTAAANVLDADTAVALAADPANCASSGLAGGVTSAGVAEACVTPHAGTNIAADLEEEVTEGSLADSTIVSADIKDGEILEADLKAVDAAVDEECLTYETTTGDFEWQTCGSGSDTNADKEFFWPASSTLPLEPADSIPPIAKDAGTNVDLLPIDFDSATDECRSVTFKVPGDITAGGTVTFYAYWYAASVTTNEVMWDFRHNSGVAEGVDPDVAVTIVAAAEDTVQGTAGMITITSWTETQTNLAWAAGDFVVGMFCRDANHASDDFAADARTLGFAITIPRS